MRSTCLRASRRHLAYSLALAFAACALMSCSTTGARAPEQHQVAADPAGSITIENLLRWPLEGEAGKRRVDAALRRIFEMKPLQAQQFSGDGPVKLSDGNVLSFAWIGELSGQVDIGVAGEPCVSPEQAAGWIGAQAAITQDAHGQDRGKTYRTQRAGNWIEFTTTPATYRCIDSINVYPAKPPK